MLKKMVYMLLIMFLLSSCSSKNLNESIHNDSLNEKISINEEIINAFDLTYAQMLDKHGPIVNANYWEGGVYVEFENDNGQYFYEFDDNVFFETRAIADITIAPEEKCHAIISKAENIFNNITEEIDFETIESIDNVADLSLSEDEAGYSGNTHIIWFYYNGLAFTIGCNGDGIAYEDSSAFISIS